ncbi:helix-turn-helix domain-containing protein [Cohnella cholangitidis]|uniref:Helix-turn-helix transcriptional regulator n=1 Tax=Cohnella cholangitidis TaxID=2598458 RepID=A0A7G5C695_9BACL|nr:helix-turn-helix transcriptional regulator [Cohnella cholangitidis]QMV44729.1 helix-turn-helix transcriptional regulator [Cohnella cholangitidis]
MAELSNLVGARIRQIRKERGITQEQLGERAQLQSTYIGGVERGERNISLDTLEKIIVALEMKLPEFFYFGDISVDSPDVEKAQLINTYISKLMLQNKREIQRMINIHKEVFDN